jgi:26S proteasome regulatory subunit N3
MVAKGFSIIVTKWLMVIRLLLGEVPERVEFQQCGMHKALQPYLELTHAVRGGDVLTFNKVAGQWHETFLQDKVHNLVNRLRYNVIRSGLRRISISYSRISLQVWPQWSDAMLCGLPLLGVRDHGHYDPHFVLARRTKV